MWRFGFALWASWQMIRWSVVGAALLFGVFLVKGFDGAFWLTTLVVGVGLYGLKRTLCNLYARERADRR